jgi:hypothetical protein
MLVFERFGYMFLFDKVYDTLREQLLNPNERLYPLRFWLDAPYPKEMCGVHFIKEKRMESIMVIFLLKTDNTERIITAFLPLPFNNISRIIKELNKRLNQNPQIYLLADSFNVEGNYLADYSQMKNIYNWIARKRRNRRR